MFRYPVFQKKGIFILYWLLILPLAGYVAYSKYRDRFKEIAPVLEHTAGQGQKIARRENEAQFGYISKTADAYVTAENEAFRRQARAALKQADNCQDLIRTFRQNATPPGPGELNRMSAVLKNLADSLLRYAGRDTVVETGLKALLYQPAAELQTPALAGFFRTGSAAQTGLYLDDQIWKTALALRLTLGNLSEQAYREDIRFDEYMPLLTAERCAEAGRDFSGKIFLNGYSRRTDNVKYFIDGRPYRPVDGVVQYRERFSRPGVYTKQIKVQIKNPLTGTTESYTMDQKINVE